MFLIRLFEVERPTLNLGGTYGIQIIDNLRERLYFLPAYLHSVLAS